MTSRNEQLAENLRRIESRVAAACARAGRDRAGVGLVAVTKQRPLEDLAALHALGLAQFGENRVQELRARVPALPSAVTWHLIGPLQTNKAKYLPGIVAWIHSVERVEVAEALQQVWEKHPGIPPLHVLVQVNIAGEEQKSGCKPHDCARLVCAVAAMPRLRLEGLMTMAPYAEDPELARPTFRGLRLLRDRVAAETGIALPHLSMGMTGDFEVAIEEGATMIRIGTALFV
jgi:pyridoxal phosphate enzyme (YggS family)